MHLAAKTILFAILVGLAVATLAGPPAAERAWRSPSMNVRYR
jgi:hypothetical protein